MLTNPVPTSWDLTAGPHANFDKPDHAERVERVRVVSHVNEVCTRHVVAIVAGLRPVRQDLDDAVGVG